VFRGCAPPLHSDVIVSGHFKDIAAGAFLLPPFNFNPIDRFAFSRFYRRVLADGNGIVLGLKRNIIQSVEKPLHFPQKI